VLDKIVSYYERAGQTVPAELAKMAAAIQLYTAAEKEAAEKKDLRQKLQDEENAATFLVAKVQELAKAWGSEKAAVTELAPVMDTVLASLLKMHGATVAEEAGRQAAIKSLKDLLGQYGLVPSALEKVMASTDKINEKHKEHELRLAELNREYALHVKTVTDAADKSAAAVAREADAVRTSMTAQIKELQKEHAEGLIENAEYFEKLNLLVSVQNLAANAAATERARLSQKERDDLDKLAEKHRETAGKIEESVKRGTDAHAAAAGDIQHSSEQIVLGLDAIAKAAIATFGDVVSGSSSTALSPGET